MGWSSRSQPPAGPRRPMPRTGPAAIAFAIQIACNLSLMATDVPTAPVWSAGANRVTSQRTSRVTKTHARLYTSGCSLGAPPFGSGTHTHGRCLISVRLRIIHMPTRHQPGGTLNAWGAGGEPNSDIPAGDPKRETRNAKTAMRDAGYVLRDTLHETPTKTVRRPD